MKSIKKKTNYRGMNHIIENEFGCRKCGADNSVSIINDKEFTIDEFLSGKGDEYIPECKHCKLIDLEEVK